MKGENIAIHFHKWLKRNFLFGYKNMFGDNVKVYECTCEKCNKITIKEFR